MDLRTSVWYVVVTVLIAAAIYLSVQLGRRCLNFLLEVFLFWVITIGAMKSRKQKSHLRMRGFLAETDSLDELSVNEIFNFLADTFTGDVEYMSVNHCHKVLLTYSHVLLCREKTDGSLRGVIAYGVTRKKNYTIVKGGMTVFKRNYQGGYLILLVTVYLFCKELILHPLTPLYSVGKMSSYRSYLLFSHSNEFFPRYDRETPKFYKELLQEFANDVKLPSEHYDPERCVLEKTNFRLQSHAAPITELELRNPHIKFYSEQNPGWKQGHCLVVAARVTFVEAFKLIARRVRTSMRPSKGRRPHPKLVKRITFVDPLANRYAVELCEMDHHSGEIIATYDTTERKADRDRRAAMYAVKTPSVAEMMSPTELNVHLEF